MSNSRIPAFNLFGIVLALIVLIFLLYRELTERITPEPIPIDRTLSAFLACDAERKNLQKEADDCVGALVQCRIDAGQCVYAANCDVSYGDVQDSGDGGTFPVDPEKGSYYDEETGDLLPLEERLAKCEAINAWYRDGNRQCSDDLEQCASSLAESSAD